MRKLKIIFIAIFSLHSCVPSFAPKRVISNIVNINGLIIDKVQLLGVLDQDYISTLIITKNNHTDSLSLFKTYECRYDRDTLFLDGYGQGGDTIVNGVIIKYN